MTFFLNMEEAIWVRARHEYMLMNTSNSMYDQLPNNLNKNMGLKLKGEIGVS